MTDINIVVENGSKKVSIKQNKRGIELLISRFEGQSTGLNLDREMLVMLQSCISQFLNHKEKVDPYKDGYCKVGDSSRGKLADCVLDEGGDGKDYCWYCLKNNIKDKNKCPYWIKP